MKISCPKCNASGSIAEHEIPESGRFVSCPRCHEGFTVARPKATKDVYLVDTCPACGFSTFGDETFSTCPKCGVVVKTFVERQREELRLKRDQELLDKKFNHTDTAPPPEVATSPLADFVDNLHPVNLISWGVAGAGIVLLGIGVWGVIDYDTVRIQTQMAERGDPEVSGLNIFVHYGLQQWLKLLLGLSAVAISLLLMKRLKIGLRTLSGLLWATIVVVPLSQSIGFIYWAMAPLPHTTSGYLIEIFNILLISALVGLPLYLLERYLHERKITSIIKF